MHKISLFFKYVKLIFRGFSPTYVSVCKCRSLEVCRLCHNHSHVSSAIFPESSARIIVSSVVSVMKLHCSISYNKTKLGALISQIYFWNETLHASDSSSVHHQELDTVRTAVVYVIQVC